MKLPDLMEICPFYFRIMAVNAYGFSDALETSKAIVPKRIFGEFWTSLSLFSNFECSNIIESIRILILHIRF